MNTKRPKLTCFTTHELRTCLKKHVIDEGTTLDKFIHGLLENYLKERGLLTEKEEAA
jgi:hypothetical protein